MSGIRTTSVMTVFRRISEPSSSSTRVQGSLDCRSPTLMPSWIWPSKGTLALVLAMTLTSSASGRCERQDSVVKHEIAFPQESTPTQLAPSNRHLPVSEIAIYTHCRPMSSDHVRPSVPDRLEFSASRHAWSLPKSGNRAVACRHRFLPIAVGAFPLPFPWSLPHQRHAMLRQLAELDAPGPRSGLPISSDVSAERR